MSRESLPAKTRAVATGYEEKDEEEEEEGEEEERVLKTEGREMKILIAATTKDRVSAASAA